MSDRKKLLLRKISELKIDVRRDLLDEYISNEIESTKLRDYLLKRKIGLVESLKNEVNQGASFTEEYNLIKEELEKLDVLLTIFLV